MAYWIYNFFLTLLLLLASPVLSLFFMFGRRFRQGFLQRICFYPREVLESVAGSRPIWIHAVSVGEVLSVRHLARQLKERFSKTKILLSTFTLTGGEIARQTGVADAVVFLPLDHPWIVRRAITLFDPSLLIFLEAEIWPNLLRLAHRRGIPTLLLSGRFSARTFRRYSSLRFFFSRVLQQFSALGMQSEVDVKRLIDLGVDPQRICVTGNLKHSSWKEVGINGEGTGGGGLFSTGKKDRQILVVGSTHRGEEEILLEVFRSLKSRFHPLLMVLAPRHPERFSEVERLLQKSGVRYEKKSQMNGQARNLPDVILLDTLGELPALYSLADVVFIGGSLVDAGGHNLMEPARFHKPILFGPSMTNFADVAEEMKRGGGAIEVRGREDLVREISGLLTDRTVAEKVGELAYRVIQRDRGVAEQSMRLISRYL
jgi:3-deoxy-D-manno-octulosonic-acid transferase